jgi:hypothetical protein
VRSDLKERTKRFALDILRLSAEWRLESLGWLLGGQLVRAGTGVGSNYRPAEVSSEEELLLTRRLRPSHLAIQATQRLLHSAIVSEFNSEFGTNSEFRIPHSALI